MKHTHTTPEDKKMFDLLTRPKRFITWPANTGTFISGVATAVGAFIVMDGQPYPIRITLSLMAPLFLEGFTHAFAKLFWEALGNSIRESKRKLLYIVLTVIFLTLFGLVSAGNLYISILASDNSVDYVFSGPESKEYNYEEYNSLLDNALTSFESDSLNAVIAVKQLSSELSTRLSTERDSLYNRKKEILSTWKDTDWFVAQRNQTDNLIRKNREQRKAIPDMTDAMLIDSMNVARARYKELVANAKTQRTEMIESVDDGNEALLDAHNDNKDTWKNSLSILICFGVFSAFIKHGYFEVRDLLSKRNRIDKDREFENNENLLIRFFSACYRGIYYWMDDKVTKLEKWVDGEEIVEESDSDDELLEAYGTKDDAKVMSLYKKYQEENVNINTLISNTYRQHERSITSKTAKARVDNLNKANSNIETLRNLGYNIHKKKDGTISIVLKVRKEA